MKGIFLALLYFLLIIFPSRTYAQFNQWTNYQDNPIITTPVNPQGPSILKINDNYKMWYSAEYNGKTSIHYMSSKDGISWENLHTNVVIAGATNDGHWTESAVFSPFVLFDDNKYKMWYVSMKQGTFKSGDPRYRIQYADSNDGISWGNYKVSMEPNKNSWETEGIGGPSVLKLDSTYHIWYTGRDRNGIWSIGYATSNNGTSWQKNTNNPILYVTENWENIADHIHGVGGPSVIFNNNQFVMFYNTGPQEPVNKIGYAISNNGISWTKPDTNPIIEINKKDFNISKIKAPSVIINNNKLWMYYSGYDGSKWSIGLATEGEVSGSGRDAIVIVPGMFASYDPYAFSTCSPTPLQNWKLVPKITEYNGLIKTLETADYIRDKDLFIFPYDWRKRVSESGADLKSFINSQVVPKNPGRKIDLIGHSLGGLVARSYLQEYDSNLIDKLITVGSPHHGVLDAYKPWAGGELPVEGPWRTSVSLITNICKIKTASLTKKDVIRKTAPVFGDLLPTETYLKRAGTHLNIEYSALDNSLQNSYLINLNSSFSGFFGKFDALTSTSFQTPKFYGVATYLEDKLLGIYAQGRPTAVLVSAPGDKTILAQSATFSNDSYFDLGFDHRGLIYSTSAISKIVQILNLSPTSIIQGQPTNYTPSLLMLLRSPAEITVKNKSGEALTSGEKFVFLPGVASGEYETTVTGDGNGNYELVVGQVTENSQNWESYKNETNPGKADIYKFKVNTDNPKAVSIIDNKAQNPLLSAKIKIEDLKSKGNSQLLVKALEYIGKVQQLQEQEDNILASKYILRTIRYLIKYKEATTNFEYKNIVLNIINNLQTAYSTIASNAELNTSQIDKKLAIARLSLSLTKEMLKRRDFIGRAATVSAASFAEGKEKLNSADELKSSDPYSSQILSTIARFLFAEVK